MSKNRDEYERELSNLVKNLYEIYKDDINIRVYDGKNDKKPIQVVMERKARTHFGIDVKKRITPELKDKIVKKAILAAQRESMLEGFIDAYVSGISEKFPEYNFSVHYENDRPKISFSLKPEIKKALEQKQQEQDKKVGNIVATAFEKANKELNNKGEYFPNRALRPWDLNIGHDVDIQNKFHTDKEFHDEVINRRKEGELKFQKDAKPLPIFDEKQHIEYLAKTVYEYNTKGKNIPVDYESLNRDLRDFIHFIKSKNGGNIKGTSNIQDKNFISMMQYLGFSNSKESSVREVTANIIDMNAEIFHSFIARGKRILDRKKVKSGESSRVYKRFINNYIDSDGKKIFKDYKTIRIYQHDDYGTDSDLSGQEKADMFAGELWNANDSITIWKDSYSRGDIKDELDSKGDIKTSAAQRTANAIINNESIVLYYKDDYISKIEKGKSGYVKASQDSEAQIFFSELYSLAGECIEDLIEYFKKYKPKVIENQREELAKSELEFLRSGRYYKEITKDIQPNGLNYRYVELDFSIQEKLNEELKRAEKDFFARKINIDEYDAIKKDIEKKREIFDSRKKEANIYKRIFDGYESMISRYGRTLKEEIIKEQNRANRQFEAGVRKLQQQAKTNFKFSMPMLINSFDIVEKVTTDVKNDVKKLESRSRSYKYEVPKSAMQGRGLENVFYETALTLEEREDVSSMGIDAFTFYINDNDYNIKPQNVTKYIRRSGLKKWLIPESVLHDIERRKNYGSYMAAMFFYLLISNTPKDEDYDYIETRTYIRKGKYKKTELYDPMNDADPEFKDGIKVLIARTAEDMAEDMWAGRREVTKQYHRHHEADEDVVRDCWEMEYKGVTFRPTDSDIKGLGDIFDIKQNFICVALLKMIFDKRTENSKIKTINFTYKNTNPRWEQLEYGGYNKNSGPWKGDLYEHGVKNHYTHQAPHGWLRLIEAQWNALSETGITGDNLDKFLASSGFNATDVPDSLIKALRKYDKSLGSDLWTYDYQNWIVVRGE